MSQQMGLCVFRAWLRLRTFLFGRDVMNKIKIALLYLLSAFSILCILAGALFYPPLMVCLGPVTLVILMLSLILFCIGIVIDRKQFYRGAILGLVFCAMFLAGYLIMCLVTGAEVDFLDFVLYRTGY